MSDFFGRLTERHADGVPPAIVPRAVSRFEAASLPVERDVIVRSANTATALRSLRGDQGPPAVERREAQTVERSAERLGQVQNDELKPAERATSTAARVEQILRGVETIVNAPAPVAEPRREPVTETGMIATLLAPRLVPAAEPRGPDAARSGIARSMAQESEPTVVRVHIGRIDVRAAAPAADRPRSRSKAIESAKPMSLDSYLSGKDRA
jgi:hypothetical protein